MDLNQNYLFSQAQVDEINPTVSRYIQCSQKVLHNSASLRYIWKIFLKESLREKKLVLSHQQGKPYFKKVERVEGLHSPVSRIHIVIFCPGLGFLISYLKYI